jgi:hypothetical protein
MPTLQALLDIWPHHSVLAADLDQKPDTVRKWVKHQRIPESAWTDFIAAAARRGRTVTADEILNANAPMKMRGWPAGKSRKRRRVRSAEARAN